MPRWPTPPKPWWAPTSEPSCSATTSWPTALVSERDVVRVVAAGADPAAVAAIDVAATKLVWCDGEDTVEQVATRMMEHYIRHVLVERDGALVGIVSARDLLGVYSSYGDRPTWISIPYEPAVGGRRRRR